MLSVLSLIINTEGKHRFEKRHCIGCLLYSENVHIFNPEHQDYIRLFYFWVTWVVKELLYYCIYI